MDGNETLPSDIEACHALIVQQHGVLDSLARSIEVLQQENEQLSLRAARGKILFHRGDREQSHADLERALTLRPTAVTVTTLGDLYAEEQQWEPAIAQYSKHITDQNADTELLVKRATAYEATGAWELAAADMLRAASQQPGLTQATFDRYRQAERCAEDGFASDRPESDFRIAFMVASSPDADPGEGQAGLRGVLRSHD
jgi:tetratricopeptide (TPR) repeat protein